MPELRWINIPFRYTGCTAEELERFMAGEWFSGAPFPPERIEEQRNDLRRQLRERDAARGGHARELGDWFYEGWGDDE